jgi:hypothetical protein
LLQLWADKDSSTGGGRNLWCSITTASVRGWCRALRLQLQLLVRTLELGNKTRCCHSCCWRLVISMRRGRLGDWDDGHCEQQQQIPIICKMSTLRQLELQGKILPAATQPPASNCPELKL